MNPREKALAIHRALLDHFGAPEWKVSSSPLDELVLTILSQNTNDNNRDRAYASLRESFPTWESVRDAGVKRVIQAIRPAGLSNQKGARIQNLLQEITERHRSLNLDFLNEMSTGEARNWLMGFKGVGPKTAAIVLLFSFGKPAFPVDTHIYRVSGRVGLRPATMSVEKAHEHLEGIFPPDTYEQAHLNIIRLGRDVCHPRKPDCQACPILCMCDYGVQQ